MYFNDPVEWEIMNLNPGGLNPYCNGCTSMIGWSMYTGTQTPGLNPYCNGCTSMIQKDFKENPNSSGLNPYCNGCTSMILYSEPGRVGGFLSQSLL